MNNRRRSIEQCFLKIYKNDIQEQKSINRGITLGFELMKKFSQNGGFLSKYITRYTDIAFEVDNIILENCFYVFFTFGLDDPIIVTGILNLVNRYSEYLETLDLIYAQHLLKYGNSEAINAFMPYFMHSKDDSVLKLYMEYAINHRYKVLDNRTIKTIENILYTDNNIILIKGVTNNGKKR